MFTRDHKLKARKRAERILERHMLERDHMRIAVEEALDNIAREGLHIEERKNMLLEDQLAIIPGSDLFHYLNVFSLHIYIPTRQILQ